MKTTIAEKIGIGLVTLSLGSYFITPNNVDGDAIGKEFGITRVVLGINTGTNCDFYNLDEVCSEQGGSPEVLCCQGPSKVLGNRYDKYELRDPITLRVGIATKVGVGEELGLAMVLFSASMLYRANRHYKKI